MTQILTDLSMFSGRLIHVDRGDEVDNLVKCVEITRTWTSLL